MYLVHRFTTSVTDTEAQYCSLRIYIRNCLEGPLGVLIYLRVIGVPGTLDIFKGNRCARDIGFPHRYLTY